MRRTALISAILGIHQMVDQRQYWAAQTAIKKGGYKDSEVSGNYRTLPLI